MFMIMYEYVRYGKQTTYNHFPTLSPVNYVSNVCCTCILKFQNKNKLCLRKQNNKQ